MHTAGYRVKIDATIAQVDQVAWDELCGGRPFSKVYWLEFLENIMADYQPSYIQLWQGERLVAGAICQPQRHFHLSAYLKNRALQKIAAQTLAWLPPYTCLLPLFLRDGLLHPAGETVVWLPHLLREVEKASRSRWAPFTYLGNLKPNEGAISQQKAYAVVPILQDSYINIAWDNFADYLSHLTSKRRYLVKSYMKQAEAAGVVIREVGLASSFAPQIETLIRSVTDKHDNTFLYRPDFLQRAQTYLNPDSYCTLVACLQDEAIACVTLFRSGDEVATKWSGMNYGRTHSTYAYHYLMIHVVKKAMAWGVQRLDFGPTSYVLKRQLGAEFEDRVAALKVRIRPFNTALQHLLARTADDANEPMA